jgi:hypothetical protein
LFRYTDPFCVKIFAAILLQLSNRLKDRPSIPNHLIKNRTLASRACFRLENCFTRLTISSSDHAPLRACRTDFHFRCLVCFTFSLSNRQIISSATWILYTENAVKNHETTRDFAPVATVPVRLPYSHCRTMYSHRRAL